MYAIPEPGTMGNANAAAVMAREIVPTPLGCYEICWAREDRSVFTVDIWR